MIFKIDFIDVLFLFILLFSINQILKNYNLLLDQPSFSNHKIKYQKKIALSGGIYFIFSLLYFKYKYFYLIDNVIFSFILLVPLGILSDKDILKSPMKRILTQVLIISSVIIFFDIQILNTKISLLDYLINFKIFNYLFTLFCILVLINGSNFIDGLNGLASGYFLLLCLSIIFLKPIDGLVLNYFEIFYILTIILTIFIIFNFLSFNFLGDNGIYFVSAIIGYSLIQFFNYNIENISPFYIVALLWYPAFENLFSIIRRLKKKENISQPDTLHFHTLIYKKVKKKIPQIYANNLSTIVILLIFSPGFCLSNIYYNQSLLLGLIILSNVFVYLIIYQYLKNEI